MSKRESTAILAGKTKIGNLLAFLSTQIPNVPMRKLLKLIYLIDEESVLSRNIPITWLTYKAWEKGPVCEDVFDAKDNGLFSDYVTIERNDEGKYIFSPNVDPDLGEFSKAEMALINSIIQKYGKMSADELTNITHEPDSLWSRVVRDNNIVFDDVHHRSDVTVGLENLLVDEGLATYNDAKECMEFQAALNCV